MKKIQNDYCIRQFVSSDKLRPALTNVSLQNGYLYSTDGCIIAQIKADLCVQKYNEVEKYPDLESVMKTHERTENKIVSVDALFDELMKIECCFKPKMVECDNCDGNGVCTCDHCDSEYNCKECKGTGKKASKEIELTSEHDCILFGKKYNLKYIDLIVRTAVYTSVKEIEISNGTDETSGTIFIVGDFTILLMPLYVEK
jgi:hypothetical protein